MKFLPLGALLCLAACSPDNLAGSWRPNRVSDWYETGRVMKPKREILSAVRETIIRQGFTIEDYDETSGVITSAWNVQLSSRFREGTRSMVEAEVLPEDDAFNVRVRSYLDVNNEDKNPSIPEKATWIAAGISEKHKDRIANAAIRLQSQLKLKLIGLGQ